MDNCATLNYLSEFARFVRSDPARVRAHLNAAPASVWQPYLGSLLCDVAEVMANQLFPSESEKMIESSLLEIVRVLHEEFGASLDNLGHRTCALAILAENWDPAKGERHGEFWWYTRRLPFIHYLIDHGAQRGGDHIPWIAERQRRRDAALTRKRTACCAMVRALSVRGLGRDLVRVLCGRVGRVSQWQEWECEK